MATFLAEEFYHVYNQGNNREPIFLGHDNYIYFISLVEKFVLPHCTILSWCLMPNHFHFLIRADERSIKTKSVGSLTLSELSNGFRLIQSSYSQAFNKRNNRTGSLFRQNSKAKWIETARDSAYLKMCFHYIHQNPLRARLIARLEDWPYSSFQEYFLKSTSPITDINLGIMYLDLDMHTFYKESHQLIKDDIIPDNFFNE
jgi:REP element-mobilizing transposase RayT